MYFQLAVLIAIHSRIPTSQLDFTTLPQHYLFLVLCPSVTVLIFNCTFAASGHINIKCSSFRINIPVITVVVAVVINAEMRHTAKQHTITEEEGMQKQPSCSGIFNKSSRVPSQVKSSSAFSSSSPSHCITVVMSACWQRPSVTLLFANAVFVENYPINSITM